MTFDHLSDALILGRAALAMLSLFCASWLFVSFVRNHFENRRTKPLVFWLSHTFAAMGLTNIYSVYLWATFISTGQQNTPENALLFSLVLYQLVALVGLVSVWVRFPYERRTDEHMPDLRETDT